MTKKAKKEQPEKFETLLARLEEIVKKLEEGDLELEEALAAFEEGVNLSRRLNDILTQAKDKVELLVKNNQGGLTSRPFEEGDLEGEDHDTF